MNVFLCNSPNSNRKNCWVFEVISSHSCLTILTSFTSLCKANQFSGNSYHSSFWLFLKKISTIILGNHNSYPSRRRSLKIYMSLSLSRIITMLNTNRMNPLIQRGSILNKWRTVLMKIIINQMRNRINRKCLLFLIHSVYWPFS